MRRAAADSRRGQRLRNASANGGLLRRKVGLALHFKIKSFSSRVTIPPGPRGPLVTIIRTFIVGSVFAETARLTSPSKLWISDTANYWWLQPKTQLAASCLLTAAVQSGGILRTRYTTAEGATISKFRSRFPGGQQSCQPTKPMLLTDSGFVCYGPQGGWHRDTPVYRTGGCLLCGLHSSVVRFPRCWPQVLPDDLTPAPFIGSPPLSWRHLPALWRETVGPPSFLTLLLFRATLLDPGRPSTASPWRLFCFGFPRR